MTLYSAYRYRIINQQTGQACAIVGNDIKNIVQYPKEDNNVSENWRLLNLNDGVCEIMSDDTNQQAKGNCFTAGGENTQVVLQSWKGINNDDQRWTINLASTGTEELYAITNNSANLALTVKDCSSAENAPITVEKFTGLKCQLWKLVSTSV